MRREAQHLFEERAELMLSYRWYKSSYDVLSRFECQLASFPWPMSDEWEKDRLNRKNLIDVNDKFVEKAYYEDIYQIHVKVVDSNCKRLRTYFTDEEKEEEERGNTVSVKWVEFETRIRLNAQLFFEAMIANRVISRTVGHKGWLYSHLKIQMAKINFAPSDRYKAKVVHWNTCIQAFSAWEIETNNMQMNEYVALLKIIINDMDVEIEECNYQLNKVINIGFSHDAVRLILRHRDKIIRKKKIMRKECSEKEIIIPNKRILLLEEEEPRSRAFDEIRNEEKKMNVDLMYMYAFAPYFAKNK